MTIKWSTQGQKTLPEALSEACAKWPDRMYLDFSGDTYTYAEVDRATTSMAHGLAEIGINKGDRLCSLLDNVSDQILIWFAANKIGAIFVPINTAMKGEFLRHQLTDSGALSLVVEARYAERVFEIEDGIPEVRSLIFRGAMPDVKTRLTMVSIDSIRANNTTPIVSPCKPRDLALLLYTSGTSGPSKGCMVSHNYAINFGRQVASTKRLVKEDVVWTPLPLFHAAAALGTVVSTLLVGATATIYPRFSASNFWPEIERSRATACSLLSTMIPIIADQQDTDISKRCYGQLRLLWGVPLTAKLIAKWKERFGVKHVLPGYGMTEISPLFKAEVDTTDLPDGSSGRASEELDVRIIDESGEECPPGVPGEIIVRPLKPDIMFQGYWRRPDATVQSMRDFWFFTGDMGKLDENGFFHFVDRKKDYLRRGGENISSFEVEATFLSHANIAEAAIHAVKSELAEDEVKLTAVLKPNTVITEEELCRWSLNRLPHFAVPRFIEFRFHLPKTPTARVQKFVLRDEGITPSTWDRKKSNIVIARQ
jgi:carnitine-CoA ligase